MMNDNPGEKIERIIYNALWREGGCEAVEEMKQMVRTCDHCGHESDEPFDCPICGRPKHKKADG